jgi:tetratricopeptide (TPR) repeat protein
MIAARIGRTDQAREAYRSAAELLDRLVAENPSATTDRDLLFRARRGLGEIELNLEQMDRAETEFQAALAALELSSAEPGETINMQIDRAAVEIRLGDIARKHRRFDEAIESFSSAIVAAKQVLSKEPKHVMAQVYLYEAHVFRALAKSNLCKYALALADWETAIEYGKGHADSAELRLRQAMALACGGRLEEAAHVADQVAADPATNLGLQFNCASVYARILAVAADRSQPRASGALNPESLTALAVKSLRVHLSDRPSLNAEIIRALAADPELEPLGPQPLFQAFLMDLAFPDQPFAVDSTP